MDSLLTKILDLPRELRLGSTWLVLATLLVGADAYAIALPLRPWLWFGFT